MNQYFEQARINMVKNQIMPNNVTDERILNVMVNTPKHLFVEGEWQSVCYFDGRVPLGQNREILSAQTIGKMLQALELKGTESVLDLACGTGYTTAILAQLCKKIVGVESDSELSVKAAHNIAKLNLNNVSIKQAELRSGAPENAPYDVLFINGALQDVPNSLLAQLSSNAKVVMLKKSGNLCSAVLLVKSTSAVKETDLFTAYGPSL